MIIWSSNLATNLLIEWLSVRYVEDVLRQAKVSGVAVRRGVDDEAAFARGMNNEATARGLVELFGVLRSEFLTKPSRDEVIRILLNQQFTSMIPSGLPKHATVAHKTGEISKVCHDAGIVYLPEREPYIVAILTENTADSDKRRDAVARISGAIYRMVTTK
jgi:beta-lactamase class A